MPDSSHDRATLGREHVHNLLMLYLAVAYGADSDLDVEEEETIRTLLASWLPEASAAFVAGMVRAALDLYEAGDALSVGGLALGLRSVLPLDLRERVLADLGRIARADGVESTAEAAVIARIRTIWGQQQSL